MFVAHEAAIHAARLRVELSQSRREQQEYLKNVELARVLDKRAQRKQKAAAGSDQAAVKDSGSESAKPAKRERPSGERVDGREKKRKKAPEPVGEAQQKQLNSVLGSIF